MAKRAAPANDTIPLSTLSKGDAFAIPACDLRGVLLDDPSYGSVQVKLIRTNTPPDVKPEVWVSYIAPGTAVIPLRQPA